MKDYHREGYFKEYYALHKEEYAAYHQGYRDEYLQWYYRYRNGVNRERILAYYRGYYRNYRLRKKIFNMERLKR